MSIYLFKKNITNVSARFYIYIHKYIIKSSHSLRHLVIKNSVTVFIVSFFSPRLRPVSRRQPPSRRHFADTCPDALGHGEWWGCFAAWKGRWKNSTHLISKSKKTMERTVFFEKLNVATKVLKWELNTRTFLTKAFWKWPKKHLFWLTTKKKSLETFPKSKKAWNV